MEKPKLVIDKDQKKVYLDGEFVGRINDYSFQKKIILLTYYEYLNKLSSLSYNNLLSFDFYINVQIPNSLLSTKSLAEDLYFSFLEKKHSSLVINLNSRRFYLRNKVSKLQEEINKKVKSDFFSFKYGVSMERGNLIFDLFINPSQEDEDLKTICDFFIRELDNLIQPHNLGLDYQLIYIKPSLSNTFTFPPEIQSSCEQYLIYFATFLKDIGINAKTNIESKAHETLFTVIPENGEEALDKIKEALQVYLKLPESPEFENIAAEFTDVGVHQLVSQVHFLKSQLALGKTMIQMKDATIETLQLTNYQQKEIIQSHQKEVKNEEELAGGLIKANEVKVKGFTFDLPELLRRIKRKF